MVAFSPRSNWGVILVSALIVLTLQVGIMVTQSAGKLEGSPMVTVVQIVMVMLIWWLLEVGNQIMLTVGGHWL